MPIFKMVKYHKRQYPSHIPLHFQEVAGHFDIAKVRADMPYSLHTEYSYGKRAFSNQYLTSFPTITSANKSGIPQLWKDEQWAKEFALFITKNLKYLTAPSVIEIHPPFDDYTNQMRDFITRYKVFETIIKEQFPNVEIHIENRCGSIYRGGKFSLSTADQLIVLCEEIERNKGLSQSLCKPPK